MFFSFKAQYKTVKFKILKSYEVRIVKGKLKLFYYWNAVITTYQKLLLAQTECFWSYCGEKSPTKNTCPIWLSRIISCDEDRNRTRPAFVRGQRIKPVLLQQLESRGSRKGCRCPQHEGNIDKQIEIVHRVQPGTMG